MKFGKRLRDLLEDSLPEWRSKFLSYKELKKILKNLPPGEEEIPGESCRADGSTTREETHKRHESMRDDVFVKLLNVELEKFNTFFMEKEEEFVIRVQVLREQVDRLKSLCANGDMSQCVDCSDQLTDLRKAIVSLHGEMVLLENYSALNYTGLVKILKKHDKRTGLLLRHPFISTVLRQPFLTTEIVSKLVKECEQSLHTLFPSSSAGSQVDDRSGAASCAEEWESTPSSPESISRQSADVGSLVDVEAVYRSALTALRSLQEIRGSSKTPHPLLAEVACCPGVTYEGIRDSESNAVVRRDQASVTSVPSCGHSASASDPQLEGHSTADQRDGCRLKYPECPPPDSDSSEGNKTRRFVADVPDTSQAKRLRLEETCNPAHGGLSL